MADRVLRGSRMGAVSYETDRDHDLAPRQIVKYRTEELDVLLEERIEQLRKRRRNAARLLKQQQEEAEKNAAAEKSKA